MTEYTMTLADIEMLIDGYERQKNQYAKFAKKGSSQDIVEHCYNVARASVEREHYWRDVHKARCSQLELELPVSKDR